MRTIYLALAALAVIAVLAYISHAVVIQTMPVLNPLNERLSVNVPGVVELYITALGLTSTSNYTMAMHLLKALGVTGAVRSLPTLAALHAHEERLASLMAKLEGVYEDTLSQVLMGNVSVARYLAVKGLALDSEAYGELNTVTNLLTTIYPNATGQVMSMAAAMRARLISINETLIKILHSPITTNMTIMAVPNIVVVGGSVTVFGKLTTSNGTAIPNATITIYVDGVPTGSAITNSTGYYIVNVTIPPIYKPILPIKALYNPPPTSKYLPTQAVTNITVIYNSTYIAINYTGAVLWGGQINVSGFISGSPNRLITLSIGNLNMSITTVNNAFNISIPTSDLLPGNYSLSIYVTPNGTYAPTTYVGALMIYALIAKPNVSVSNVAIAGLPVRASINVSPWVSGLPITVSLGGSAISLNLTSPNITITLATPLLLGMGVHDLVVSVGQRPPIGGGYYARGIFVVNPLEIALPAIALIMVMSLARFGIVRLRRSPQQETQALPTPPMAATITTPRPAEVKAVEKRIIKLAPSGKINIPSVREVVMALSQAIAAVSMKTEVRLKPTQTLREYLTVVREKLDPQVYSVLSELVGIAEYALYSPRVPTPVDVARAWELAKVLSQ